MSMEKIIKLENITKVYTHRGNKTVACKNISFEVAEGDSVSLLGLNGAGKTTLIHILCASILPTSGEAYICGYNTTDAISVKQNIGVLHEKNPLYEHMKVFEFLHFYQNMYEKDNTDDINQMCELFGLTELKQTAIKNLSKGFKQRVGLAACTIHKPRLLILDEPSSGLDAMQQREFENILVELQKQTTLILCTHDLEQAARVCKRHILLHKGIVCAQGTLEDIYKMIDTHDVASEIKINNGKQILEKAFKQFNNLPTQNM